MTEVDRREAIASLTGSQPYRLLLEDLDNSVNGLLAELVEAKTDGQVLRLARMFQVIYRYHQVLKTVPEKLRSDIESEIEQIKSVPGETMTMPFMPHRQALLNDIEALANQGPHGFVSTTPAQ